MLALGVEKLVEVKSFEYTSSLDLLCLILDSLLSFFLFFLWTYTASDLSFPDTLFVISKHEIVLLTPVITKFKSSIEPLQVVEVLDLGTVLL